jgi:pyrroloquinoline-quinone synthase
MDLLDRLDVARGETNVLEHPFYVRWSAGELTAAELARYSQQYRHAVLALAEASRLAAASAGPADASALEAHAAEELAHVALWDQFAAATSGESAPTAPTNGTRACVEAWTAGAELLEHLAILYVIEAGQPEVSRTKLAGLVDHYGFASEGPAVAYFRLHEELDVAHAAAARESITRLLGEHEVQAPSAERVLAGAQAALSGNWSLLDEV